MSFINVRGLSDKNYYNLTTEMGGGDVLFEHKAVREASKQIPPRLCVM